MPYVNIKIAGPEPTKEQKDQVFKEVTETLVRVLYRNSRCWQYRRSGRERRGQKKGDEMSEFSKADIERKITLEVGDKAPEFEALNQDGVKVALKDFIGKNVVLYFYPKDNTPGCTTEACEFSANYDQFIKNDTVIIGVSPDSVKSHVGFIAKQNLKHILLSDEDKEISKLYGVWQVKKNYGKEYLGIVRSTFVIGKDGKIVKIYKSVKAKDHAAKVLADLAK